MVRWNRVGVTALLGENHCGSIFSARARVFAAAQVISSSTFKVASIVTLVFFSFYAFGYFTCKSFRLFFIHNGLPYS